MSARRTSRRRGKRQEAERSQGGQRPWDLERLRREYILAVLQQTHGDRADAARILGIDPRTLSARLQRYQEPGDGGAQG